MHYGTPEGAGPSRGRVSFLLSETTPSGPTGNVQHISPVLIPTEMDLSTWLGSTGGTTADTDVPLGTSSTGLQDSATNFVRVPQETTSLVTDKAELGTVTWVSTALTPPTAPSKKAVTTGQQARGPVGEAYSSAVPRSEQTSGRDLALRATSVDTDTAVTIPTAHVTPATPWVSDGPDSAATASLMGVARETAGSSPAAASPVRGPNSESTSGLETSDTTSPPRTLSVTSFPVGLTGKSGSLALEVTTSGHRRARSVSMRMPSPERKVWTTDSTQAVGTSSGTVTDTAAHLHVTGVPEVSSTLRTLSSLTSATAAGSTHYSSAPAGTRLARLLSAYPDEITEVSTRLKTLSPEDTTMSAPTATFSDDHRVSLLLPEISGANVTPKRPEITAFPISITFPDKPGTQTNINNAPPSFRPDVSTRDFPTAPASSASTRDSTDVETTGSPEFTLGSSENLPTLAQLSPAGTFLSDRAHSTNAPENPTRSPRNSPSPIMTQPAEMPLTTRTGHPGATAQDSMPLDTSTTISGARTLLAETQNSTHSEVTDLMSRGPEDVSRTGPSFVEPSSSSVLESILAPTSPLPVSPTAAETGPTSPSPLTTLWTSGRVKTTDVVGTSLGARARSPENLSDTTVETLATPQALTESEAVHLSKNTAVTSVGSTSSGHETHSPVPADSGPSKVTSAMVTSSILRETTVPTSMPGSSETPWFKTEPASSVAPSLRGTSTSQPMSSGMETIAVFPSVPTEGGTEVPRTEGISSATTPSSGPFHSTTTPDVATEMPRLSTSPIMTGPSGMFLTRLTHHPGPVPPDTSSLSSSKMSSWAGTDSAVTPSVSYSGLTTIMNSVPDDLSGTSTSFMDEISSPPFLMSLPAMNSHPPLSSILPGFSPTSLSPGTSFSSTVLVRTTDMVSRSSESGARFSPNLHSPSIEILAVSETSTDAGATRLSQNTGITSVGTSSSGRELHSSVPIYSESPSITYPMDTAPSLEETTLATSAVSVPLMPTSFETVPLLHPTSGLKVTSKAVDFSSAPSTPMPSPPQSAHLVKSPRPGAADFLSSAETLPGDTLTPSLSESTTNFVTSGVPGVSSIACPSSPFCRTESVLGDTSMSTIARILPSSASTPFPFSTFATTGSSTGPAPHGITSSPTPPRAVDATREAKISTADGPVVMVGSLETWTQSVWTSLSPITATRKTQNTDLGTVTSASQVSPHSTQLTRLPAGGTERAQTTTRATSATRVSAPTFETLTVLTSSGKMANTGTPRVTITTADASPDLLERTGSTPTRAAAETSSTAGSGTTRSMSSRRPAQLVVGSAAESSTLVPPPGGSFGEPQVTTSWPTRPVETTSRTSLNDSKSKSDTTLTMATSTEEEVSLAVSTWTLTPSALGVENSLVTSGGKKTSMFPPTLIGSTDETDTIPSWVTTHGTSFTVPATVAPHTTTWVTAQDTRTGVGTSATAATSTRSQVHPDTTASWATQFEREARSAVPTLTAPHREPDPTVSVVTRPSETGLNVSQTTSKVSHSDPDTMSSTATGPGAGASSALPTVTVPPEVLTVATSLVTSSATEASTTFSTGTVSTDDPDPSISSVTRPAESSSTVPGAATSVSRSDSDSTAPMAPSLGTEASSAGPDVPLSSPEVPGHHSPMGEPPCSTDCFSRANCDWFR
nr:mucin-16 [Desmodus rotundus]